MSLCLPPLIDSSTVALYKTEIKFRLSVFNFSLNMFPLQHLAPYKTHSCGPGCLISMAFLPKHSILIILILAITTVIGH